MMIFLLPEACWLQEGRHVANNTVTAKIHVGTNLILVLILFSILRPGAGAHR
jgi:hypothetical protein